MTAIRKSVMPTQDEAFPKQAYSIDEFILAFDVSKTETYSEIKAGNIKVAKVGKKTLIPAASAQAWLDSKMVTPEQLRTDYDRWGRRRKASAKALAEQVGK